jgi:hemerythrin
MLEITPLIAWNNEMSIGIESIDAQHKKLVALINDLYVASNEGLGKEFLGRTLDGLIAYTIEHFNHEEGLFLKTDYPDAEEHIKEHAKLKDDVMAIKAKFESGDTATLSEEVLRFLVKWLMNHTLGMDKHYRAHLIAAGVQ